MVLAGNDSDSSPRVDRENTGTSIRGGMAVTWRAYEVLTHWHSNKMIVVYK